MTGCFVGIDPGLAGGLAVLDLVAELPRALLFRTPTLMLRRGRKERREYDVAAMHERLTWVCDRPSRPTFVLELQGARPAQGVVSQFRCGIGFGLWWGLVVACRAPYQVITPLVWKRHHGLVGMNKPASRLRAQALFPELGVLAPADEGPAEALLLAVYAAAKGGQAG